MSVTINIGMKKVVLDKDEIPNHITELEKNMTTGRDFIITVIDPDTTNFHRYVFEYLTTSNLTPRNWVLNNLLWSLTCDETLADMKGLFNELIINLRREFMRKCS